LLTSRRSINYYSLMAETNFTVIKISKFLKFDPNRNQLFWKQNRIRYRVALWLIPRNEVRTLCKYFDQPVDMIEEKFKLV
jgi:hypothetical protein